MESALDWTEKYRPKTLDDVVGNRKAKRELRKWASRWSSGKPEKKAVILAGEPGIGKTSSAIALANEMGWEALEMNASDERNSDAIKDFIGRSAVDDSFSEDGDFIPYKDGSRKLLILDEADNIFGKEDYGGIREISNTIYKTEQPMVLIANDYYDLRRRSNKLANLCKKIDFQPVDEREIIELLRDICRKEEIKCRLNVLKTIAKRAKGDVRSAIRDLESIAAGREKITTQALESLGTRNREAEIFPTLEIVLQKKDPLKARKSIEDLNEEPQNLLLWIDENLPREYKNAYERSKGFNWLSKADVYLGRVYKNQYYRFWRYATDLMSAGVNVAKNRGHSGWTRYSFPTWLRKMSQSKGSRSKRRRISLKIAGHMHTTTKRVNSDIYPYFKSLFNKQVQFRQEMVKKLDLTEEDAAFILDSNIDSEKVQELFEEETEELETSKVEEKDKKEKEEKGEEKQQQKSLLEF